ncbi:MAG: hypothetical protein WBM75_21750 [Polyangiales bacterium]
MWAPNRLEPIDAGVYRWASCTLLLMSKFKDSVSIQPHFTFQEGKMDEARQILDRCVAASANEEGSYFYNFTVNGNVVFCREFYLDADAVLAHLGNVGALIEELLERSELTRCEVHGPAAELEKLKEPMAALHCDWFTVECGVEK